MKKNILVIGDIFLDIFTHGSINRISPENDTPVFKYDNDDLRLGGAANVALNLTKLGVKTTLIGKISNDKYGKELKKILKKNKINFYNLYCKNTIIKQRFYTKYGQVLRVDKEEICLNTEQDYKKIIKHVKKKYDAIYVADYEKGLIDKKINKILNKKKLIFCDPKNKDLSIFKGFDFIKPNEKYIRNFITDNYEDKKFTQKIRDLGKKYNIKNFLITLGEKGSLFINNTKRIYQKAQKVDFYDLSGAGDTFGSIFIKEYLEKKKIENILNLANIGSGKVIAKKGTSSISLQELENEEKKIFYFRNDKKKIIEVIKNQKGKIGYTNGCFDILHAGHISLLKFAKSECDFLICAINSDNSVKKLKGLNRPFVNEKTRAELLINLNYIDMVIIFSEKTPYNQIKLIKPDIIIKGSDYKKNQVVGFNLVNKYGGQIKLAKILKNFSTSRIISKYEKRINS